MQRRIQRRVPLVEDRLPADWHPVLRRVYCNRGVGHAADADRALGGLLPFDAMKGLDAAVSLLVQALREQRRICIVGDYDADGATSTALMMAGLRSFGVANRGYLVPDRFRFGYGLTPEIVALAQAQRPRPELLITVDNGIASLEGVASARAAGMQVLITDHHLPGRVLPDADAIVNPNQPGCGFASKALAGVGVAFYLLIALRARLRAEGVTELPHLASLLDLVALGTVADVVPLDRNNRILVEQGLRQIRAGRCRPGLRALLQVAGRDPARACAADLGFAAGPRLNAAGRLEDMSVGIACLLSEGEAHALTLAHRLDEINRERRELQQRMQDEALLDLEALGPGLPFGLCLYDAGWHQGVIGLVAGRVKERHHRPAIAFAPADAEATMLKGSARSVAGLHIRDALDAIATRNPGLISRFGGHAMAAGLSLERRQYETFRAEFDAEVRRWLKPADIEGLIETDGELAGNCLTLELGASLREAGPWGQAFPEPLFDGVFEVLDQRIVADRHLKLRLKPADAPPLDAIVFSRTEPCAGGAVRAAYRLDINEHQGLRSLQAIVEYLEPA